MKKEKFHIQTPATHRKFILSLSCARCDTNPVVQYSIGGDAKLSLPLCLGCFSGVEIGHTFRDHAKSKIMAHNLCLLSGDFYSAAMIVAKSQKEVFL